MNVKKPGTVASLLFLLFSLSCTTATKEGGRIFIDGKVTSVSDKHPSNNRLESFNQNNIDQIEMGMSPNGIEELFGPPDMSFTTQFGSNTNMPWQGLVYRYHTVPDLLYKNLNVFKSNTFIFVEKEDKYHLEETNIQFVQLK
ncbi:hypothetical protein GF407_00185 [candidate division KSB1 bacterium]|nr:hypothetical protein [candidate division KSB1 bacterium]